MNTRSSLATMLNNIDFATFVQGSLAVLVTLGCFLSWLTLQQVPEWATNLLVLIYGFFFGSRFGVLTEKNKRSSE